MTVLRNPDTGSIIQATGRLETRLIGQGWTPTNDPPSPGLRLVTAAELDQLTDSVASAVVASQTDRSDLRSIIEPMAVQLPEVAAEVDQLTATVEAVTTAAAPKSTPRTDALEQWRAEAETAIADIQATVAAIDVPAAVEAWLTTNPPPAGQDGAASTVPGPQGPPGADSTVPGPKGETGDTGAASTVAGPQGIQGVPGPNLARKAIVNTGSLSANTVKQVAVTFSPAMPDTAYAVVALVETSTPQTVAVGLVAGSRTVNGCSLAVRSTAAVNPQGLNVHVLGLA